MALLDPNNYLGTTLWEEDAGEQAEVNHQAKAGDPWRHSHRPATEVHGIHLVQLGRSLRDAPVYIHPLRHVWTKARNTLCSSSSRQFPFDIFSCNVLAHRLPWFFSLLFIYRSLPSEIYAVLLMRLNQRKFKRLEEHEKQVDCKRFLWTQKTRWSVSSSHMSSQEVDVRRWGAEWIFKKKIVNFINSKLDLLF